MDPKPLALAASAFLLLPTLAFAASPADAHVCAGQWPTDCGPCPVGGGHIHTWTQPSPGGCFNALETVLGAVERLVNG